MTGTYSDTQAEATDTGPSLDEIDWVAREARQLLSTTPAAGASLAELAAHQLRRKAYLARKANLLARIHADGLAGHA